MPLTAPIPFTLSKEMSGVWVMGKRGGSWLSPLLAFYNGPGFSLPCEAQYFAFYKDFRACVVVVRIGEVGKQLFQTVDKALHVFPLYGGLASVDNGNFA